MCGLDLKLVVRPFRHTRDENFPDAAPDQLAHWMNTPIPKIEIAHHADPSRVRCPDREIDAALPANLAQMRAELVVKPLVISLREKVQIHLAHDRLVAVGIAQQLLRAIEGDHLDQIGKIPRLVRHGCLVKPLDVEPFRREDLALVFRRDDLNFLRLRAKNADDQIVPGAMRTEDPERIGMRSVQQGGDFVRIDGMDGK